MASASSLLSEELLRCVVCLDVFTDPISTPCGHTFCRSCITHYWDTCDVCQCPLCKTTFNTKPEVSVNTCISEMVHQFRRLKWKVEFEAKTEDEIQQMVQERQLKIQEVKHSVELSRKDADTVIAESVQVFTALTSLFAISSFLSSIERSQAELIAVIEEKQETTEKQAEGFIKDLEKEITQLEKRISELKQLSHTPPPPELYHHIHPLKDWTKVNVHQFSYAGTVRTAVAQLEKTLEKTLGQEMEKKLCDVELRRIQQYEVDVTLDSDTAHPELILSEDGKQVSHGDIENDVPVNTKRFSTCVCVLGKQSFSPGRFYYEVQVKGKTDWYLGVARESINRKEDIYLSPDDGCWAIGLENGNEYKAYNTDPDDDDGDVLLPVREELQKVGVFVDYEESLVSFYDVEARVHLYSFTGCSFTEKLYPFFSPCFNHGGRNSAPLIISPVNMDAGLGGDGGNMSPPNKKRRKT